MFSPPTLAVRCCHVVLLFCVWGADWRRGSGWLRLQRRSESRMDESWRGKSGTAARGDDLVMRCAAVVDWSLQKRWRADLQRAASGEREESWWAEKTVRSKSPSSQQRMKLARAFVRSLSVAGGAGATQMLTPVVSDVWRPRSGRRSHCESVHKQHAAFGLFFSVCVG